MKKQLILLLGSIVLLSAAAEEKKIAPISVTTASYQQIVVRDKKGKIVRDKKGKPVKKWVKATKVVPGTIVKYEDRVTNNTKNSITQVKISNPINENLEYISDSIKCDGNCSMLYSVDNGRHFDLPEKLFVGKGKKRHQAQPKEYNALQWTIAKIDANSTAVVEFRAKLR